MLRICLGLVRFSVARECHVSSSEQELVQRTGEIGHLHRRPPHPGPLPPLRGERGLALSLLVWLCQCEGGTPLQQSGNDPSSCPSPSRGEGIHCLVQPSWRNREGFRRLRGLRALSHSRCSLEDGICLRCRHYLWQDEWWRSCCGAVMFLMPSPDWRGFPLMPRPSTLQGIWVYGLLSMT